MATPDIRLTQWSRLGHADPLVVCVHGSAQGSAIGGDQHFSAQARLAPRGWRVVAPDRPGHGLSPSRGLPDDPEIDGQWVAELLGDGAHLVGHSFGGAVALAAAAMRPSAVRSLTLIEAPMHNIASGDPDVQARSRRLMETFASATSPADLGRRFVELAGIPPEMTGVRDEAGWESVGKSLSQIRLPTEPMLREALEVIVREGIPLMTVSGGWSPGIDAVSRTVAQRGGGRHVLIKSPHHFAHLISDEFNDTLVDFMTEADRRK